MSSTTVMLLPVIRKRRKNIEKMNIKPQDSYNNIRQNNYTIFNCILCDKKSHFPYLLIYSKCFPRISFQFNWNVIDESAALLPKHLQMCLWSIAVISKFHCQRLHTGPRCLAQRLDQSVTYHLHIYGLVSYVTK